MRGTQVRIIVHEPANWNAGNLFGTVINDRGGKRLILELLKDSKLPSTILELIPRGDKATFKPLMQYYSVMVDGVFLDANGVALEKRIYGSVTID